MNNCLFKRVPPFSVYGHWSFRITPVKVNKKTCEFLVKEGGNEIGIIKYSWNFRKYFIDFHMKDLGKWGFEELKALGRMLEDISTEYNPQNIKEFPIYKCL